MGHAVDNMYIVSHKSIVIEYCRYYDKGQKYKYLDSSRLLYAKRTCKRLDPLYCTSMKQSVQCWAFDPMLRWRCEWVWRRVLKTDRRDRRFSRLYLMEWTLFGFDPGTVPIFIALYQSTISLPPQKGVQSPKAFIRSTLHWMNPLYGYSYTHICKLIKLLIKRRTSTHMG